MGKKFFSLSSSHDKSSFTKALKPLYIDHIIVFNSFRYNCALPLQCVQIKILKYLYYFSFNYVSILIHCTYKNILCFCNVHFRKIQSNRREIPEEKNAKVKENRVGRGSKGNQVKCHSFFVPIFVCSIKMYFFKKHPRSFYFFFSFGETLWNLLIFFLYFLLKFLVQLTFWVFF